MACNCPDTDCAGNCCDPVTQVKQGLQGATGATGATGADGAIWLTGAIDPVAGDGNVGDFYLNSTDGDWFYKSSPTNWTPKGSMKGDSGPTFLTIPIHDGLTASYVTLAPGTYTEVARFIYAGSTNGTEIAAIYANIWMSSGGSDCSYKVVDLTNTNDLGESSGISTTVGTNLKILSGLANIPTARALFSVQVRRDNGAANINISSIILEF